MIALKLLSTFFFASCALNSIQISNANLEPNFDITTEEPKLNLRTLVNQYTTSSSPLQVIEQNSTENAEISSKHSKPGPCGIRDQMSSIPPTGIQQHFEAIVGIASKGATLNPHSSIDQYESLLILLRVVEQNFKVNMKELKNNIVDGSLRVILRDSALMKKSIQDLEVNVTHCASTYDNRTFSQLHKFFVYDNTPCDPLVDYFKHDIQYTIQAVEKIRDDLKSCVESKSLFNNKLCDSIAVSAAFLTSDFISSTKKLIKQQNEVYTSMGCCMNYRVSKVMQIFDKSLTSFRDCVRELDPSFDLEDVPVVGRTSECVEKFPFLDEYSHPL